MSVRVETREFEFSHGRKPRGRGEWAFFFQDASVFWHNGSFTEARAAAVKVARSKGFREVKVGA